MQHQSKATKDPTAENDKTTKSEDNRGYGNPVPARSIPLKLIPVKSPSSSHTSKIFTKYKKHEKNNHKHTHHQVVEPVKGFKDIQITPQTKEETNGAGITSTEVATLFRTQPPQRHKTRKGKKTVCQLIQSQAVTKQQSNRMANSEGQAKPTQGGLLAKHQHPNKNKIYPGHQGGCDSSCCHSVKDTLLCSCREDPTPNGVLETPTKIIPRAMDTFPMEQLKAATINTNHCMEGTRISE